MLIVQAQELRPPEDADPVIFAQFAGAHMNRALTLLTLVSYDGCSWITDPDTGAQRLNTALPRNDGLDLDLESYEIEWLESWVLAARVCLGESGDVLAGLPLPALLTDALRVDDWGDAYMPELICEALGRYEDDVLSALEQLLVGRLQRVISTWFGMHTRLVAMLREKGFRVDEGHS